MNTSPDRLTVLRRSLISFVFLAESVSLTQAADELTYRATGHCVYRAFSIDGRIESEHRSRFEAIVHGWDFRFRTEAIDEKNAGYDKIWTVGTYGTNVYAIERWPDRPGEELPKTNICGLIRSRFFPEDLLPSGRLLVLALPPLEAVARSFQTNRHGFFFTANRAYDEQDSTYHVDRTSASALVIEGRCPTPGSARNVVGREFTRWRFTVSESSSPGPQFKRDASLELFGVEQDRAKPRVRSLGRAEASITLEPTDESLSDFRPEIPHPGMRVADHSPERLYAESVGDLKKRSFEPYILTKAEWGSHEHASQEYQQVVANALGIKRRRMHIADNVRVIVFLAIAVLAAIPFWLAARSRRGRQDHQGN